MECPFCKETIQDGAIKCKHCGSMLNGQPVTVQPIQQQVSTVKSGIMPLWGSISLTLFILFVVTYVASDTGTSPKGMMAIVVIATAIWAGIDASKNNISTFKNSFCKKTWHVVVGMLLLWVVVFPWYLNFRSKVKAGLVLPA